MHDALDGAFVLMWRMPLLVHLQVSDEQLVNLMEQVNERTQQKTKVTIHRRRAFDDDD
jgi:hypothetical protein